MRYQTLAAALASFSVLALAGCTFGMMSEKQFQEGARRVTTYDASHSYAWNVMRLGGYATKESGKIGIADTYIADGEYERLRQSIRSAAAASAVSDPGIASSELLVSWKAPGAKLPPPPPTGKPQYKPFFIGYLPRAETATAAQAQARHKEILMDAYAGAAKDLGFTNVQVKQTSLTADRASTHGSLDIQIVGGFATYAFLKDAVGELWQTRVPEWIDRNRGESWAIGAFATEGVLTWGRFDVVDDAGGKASPDKSIELKGRLLDRVAAHLPDNYFVYIPTFQTSGPDGKSGRLMPHCIANNKGKFYFVMPQSAKRESENK